MNWQNIETAPLNQDILVAWGTKTSGVMGYEVAVFYGGEKWSEDYSGGYIPLAWMPIPPLPKK